MNRFVVVLGVLVAVGAAWATAPIESPPQRRIRGLFRVGGGAAAPADDAAAPETGPVPTPAAEPPKPKEPELPVRTVRVVDVTLPTAANARDLTFPKINEIHVTSEEQMSWVAGGKSVSLNTFGQLSKGLGQRRGNPVVVVADGEAPWQQVRWIVETAQEAGFTDVHVGAARPEEPDVLRTLPFTQLPGAGDPLPEGELFRVGVGEDEGEFTVNGAPLDATSLEANLAMAWNDWRRSRPGGADAASPETTRVVLEVHRSAPFSRVVRVLDVLRGVGIQAERLPPATPSHPR